MANAAPAPQLFNVQIDGVWHQFPKGTRLIEACEQAGRYVPHYCYHKKLSSPGNCRMCLIEMGMPRMGPDRKPELGPDGMPIINWMPRPQISCAQDIADGMGVRTNSPLVKECQRGVMEFLLINHPLDCPICDQAGECRLQEFSVDFGNSKSRFCEEIAHDDVLGFVDRGSYTVLTAHPGKRLENNYSLNTVDICPVGALTSTDFRFKMRVWFLKETKSICTSCATGCNTLIGTREDIVYRQTPRENDHVNSCWMCDYGRLNFKYLESENRLLEPQISNGKELVPSDWESATAHAALRLRQFSGANIAIIASGRMTNEELWLTRKIAELLGARYIDIVPRRGEGDDILLSEDRNPNATGAQLILGLDSEPGAKLPAIVKGVKSGEIRALLVFGENPVTLGISGEQLTNMPAFVAMDILSNAANEYATVRLPASGFAEKRGSMINGEGRLQRLNRAVRPPGNARDDWEILRDLLQALGGSNGIYTIEDVFRQMSAEIPELAGLTLNKIGDLGVNVTKEDESPRPPIDPEAKDIEKAEKSRPAGR